MSPAPRQHRGLRRAPPVAAALLLLALSGVSGTRSNNTRCEKTSEKRVFLDSCLQQLPPMLTQAQISGLPKSKQEIDTICNAFKTGMTCIDEYTKACLSTQERLLMEEQVAGARQTFRFLCDDRKFQAEYLQHTSCYRGMSRDWDSCADRFMGLVREETTRKNVSEHTKLIGLCCAKFGFLRCIFVTSRYKCQHEAAVFLHRIAETLANVRVQTPQAQCHGVSEAVCSARSPSQVAVSPLTLLLGLVIMLVTHK